MLETKLCGRPAFFYEKTDSTNTRAKLFAESGEKYGHEPIVFLSRTQSAGRGTRARTFESPEGGLYMSLLFKPTLPKEIFTNLTAYTAVAVCRAIERITGSLSPKIKWVNDITVNDKKLAGILTEGSLSPTGECEYAIIGIGLNLRAADHTEEVKGIMTTLSECGFEASAEACAEAVLTELLPLLKGEENTKVMAEYRTRSSVIGRTVNVRSSGECITVLATDITDGGTLICRDNNGALYEYRSGDVSILPV